MIRIRTGTSWRDDPRVAAGLRAGGDAARELTDALAFEVEGVDLAAGLAEAPLLPSLEDLLSAVSRVVSGGAQAAVVLGDGGIELVLRRKGGSVLLTVVALGRPSRILSRDVAVDVEALAAAALEAAAQFCRDLAAAAPGFARDARPLRTAVRLLARSEPRDPSGTTAQPSLRRERPAPGKLGCALEIDDREGLLAAYEGGRPDLGSLLVPGRLALLGPSGAELLAIGGHPFLALRDLIAAADRALCAARRGDPRVEIPLARPGRGVSTLTLELAAGAVRLDGRPVACAPLPLLRAVAEAALELCRVAREENARQAENAHLAELEASATARLAELEELSVGDLAGSANEPAVARVADRTRPDPRPLGPGRLRRLSFRKVVSFEVGSPACLAAAGKRLVVGGLQALVCVERETGAIRWRAAGATLVAPLPGVLLAARAERLWALSPGTGRIRWERSIPGGPATGAVHFARGPLALVEPGAVTGLDPATGDVAWRFAAPGAARSWAAVFGAVLVTGSDAGFLHGVDAAGRLLWRVRAPGPILRAPVAWGRLCLAVCETASGAALLAVDAATGVRRFEAPLELTPSGAPVPWGRRLAVAGTVAGDPAVTVLDAGGAPAWTSAPALSGAPAVLPVGELLVMRDAAGALLALARDGQTRWSRPAPEGAWRGPRPLAAARDTLVVAGDGLSFHALETGEILGALPAVSATRLAVDGALSVAALDLDGLLTVHRLSTHLSVV
ncbi:MAG TPA: PQQ-binding-like beta-propeller repeat protein [Anaeromyxobacter sp.]|nr:PQQ-binding-like beta-propeller repeat protein [Anaeromyxobacter sp.]